MLPRRPQHRLAHPLLRLQGGVQRLALQGQVLEVSRLDEVHVVCLVPRVEDEVRGRQGSRYEGGCAEPVHERLSLHAQAAEERVRPHDGQHHLVAQLVLQRLGQLAEDPDVLGPHEVLVLHGGVLQELDDAQAQLLPDSALPQVAPQQPELLHLVALEAVQVRHGGGDAADDGGEGDQREEEHEDGEDALADVLGAHVHGRRRELRQAPVEGGRVPVGHRLVLHAAGAGPTPGLGLQRPPP
mmetsp:Transcript_77269/g.240075  ORF Transcript_77269/g.240075 Transcript_77269/m.240075 type:complete len:241 (-) Transcript_77269:37-759(-)